MTPKLFRVILPVTDIDLAARFYGKLLGDPGRRISDGRHYFTCGDTILACFDPQADGDGRQAKPNPEELYFAVADVEAVHEMVETAGGRLAEGEVHGDPAGAVAVRPWGERSFYATDPFGNPICFVDEETVFTGE